MSTHHKYHKRPCPCGSNTLFDDCCQPRLEGYPAPTAEALMRSRYTAYVTGDTEYLLSTWHPDTRPVTLDLSNPAVKWLSLKVLDVQKGDEHDEIGEVEFMAKCKINGKAEKLHERSRFVRKNAVWVYVDGQAAG